MLRINRLGTIWFLLLVVLVEVKSTRIAFAQSKANLPPSHSITPKLFMTGLEFAEGPAFDAAGNFFVCNYRQNGIIGRVSADGAASIFCDLNFEVPIDNEEVRGNGIKIDSLGRLIVADSGGGRLLRVAEDGRSVEILAARFEGARFRSVNDVALDLQGNIYFTDPGGSSLEDPIGSVYRYTIATKSVNLVATGLAFPNGVAVSPDQKTLYVVESKKRRVISFDISTPTENAVPQSLIVFPSKTVGLIKGGEFEPGGMVFDKSGNLYVCMWTGGVVNVVSTPDGKLIRQYEAGGSKATNCHFWNGGLYVTVAAKEAVFRLDLGLFGFKYTP